MDIRFLTLMEFQNVHFFRFITFSILLAVGCYTLVHLSDISASELALIVPCLLVMAWRFVVEWLRLEKCGPACIHNDELVISRADGHRRVPLREIRSVTSKHSIFMVRRYRSWSEHLAFLEFTLGNGERVRTLVESAVFEFPAGKETLAAVQAAVLAAKMKST